ncbi:MAG: hypothetical protein HZA54_17155, partial [Planctomycetes bacterium]|nr:hypothetical protein [Planctomycetota bacterium]
RRYLAQLLLLTLPLGTLALAGVGLAVAVRQARRAPRDAATGRFALTAAWLFLPPLYVAARRIPVYDGVRHVLFVLPALTVFAGVGADATARWARARGGRSGGIALAALAVALLAPVDALVRLHPYQYAYFNALAGGTGGAWQRYDAEFWATSYKEAMAWIATQPLPRDGRPLRVLVAGSPQARDCAASYAGPTTEVVAGLFGGEPGALPTEYDYFLATTRMNQAWNFADTPILFQVERAGAVFAVVRGREGR